MTPEERDTMIKIGKAVTDLAATVEKMKIASNLDSPKPVQSPFVPEKVSVVDHEGTLNRFKMELKFEGGEMMAEQQRMDHSIRLLTEMEELLREYGVTKLTGTYERTLKPISA